MDLETIILREALAMIKLEESFGHSGDQTHYLTFCPMANDNKGAYWLQTHNTVDNSFYGASMLRCGSIKDEFQSQNQATGSK